MNDRPDHPHRRVKAPSALAALLTGLLAGAPCGAAGADAAPQASVAADTSASAPMGPTRLQGIETPQPMYPPAARAAGHQGTVVISVLVSEHGELLQARVQRSSRSPALDQAALDAVHRWRFAPATDPLGRPIEAAASVPFTFRKDSAASLPRKTCAELNTDLARWRTLEPDAPLQQADVYPLAQQLALDGLHTAAALQQAIRRFPQAFEQAVQQCTQQPQARVMELIRAQMQALSTAASQPAIARSENRAKHNPASAPDTGRAQQKSPK